MFVRVSKTPNSPRQSVRVVASLREGCKVRQILIHHLGTASDPAEVEKLKQLGRCFITQAKHSADASPSLRTAKKNSAVQAFALDKKRGRRPIPTLEAVSRRDRLCLLDLCEEHRQIDGIHEVVGACYDALGFNTLLGRQKDQILLKDLVLMRIANPTSKLMTQQLLTQRFTRTHNLDAIYRVMDKLLPQRETIKQQAFQNTRALTPQSVDVLFFDCTTLYFESTEVDELRTFGYSKDHRFNTTQVVLALATTVDGLPVGYELFEGKRAEVSTLLTCIETWKHSFPIGSVCFVADRAMMSQANQQALDLAGYQYIIAAKLRTLPRPLMEKVLDPSQYTPIAQDTLRIGEFEHQGCRLIVSYRADRATRDQKQRQQVVDKLKKALGGQEGNTQTLITNQGVKRYTRTRDARTGLDEEKIRRDERWDGLHGIVTNVPSDAQERGLSAQALLRRYAQLWKIEESFRINKHTLSMRPIYHFKPQRIQAHIAICYMAYAVLRSLEYTLRLKTKMSLETLLDELRNVQSSLFRHLPSGRRYRIPNRLSHNASRIYRAFNLTRNGQAQILA